MKTASTEPNVNVSILNTNSIDHGPMSLEAVQDIMYNITNLYIK